ncbi:serine protease [Vibrio pectenicida]
MKNISLYTALIFSSASYAIENGAFLNWSSSYSDIATFNCTGTVIAGNKLITASHCEPQKNSVYLADSKLLSATSSNHPTSLDDEFAPDVSVWTLPETVQTENIRFIANLNTDPVNDNDYVTILGFAGGTELNSAKTMINSSFSKANNWYRSTFIGNGITQGGDSGGPWLNEEGKIVAIHRSVDDDSSMIATRLYSVKDWLLKEINGWHYPTVKTGSGNLSIKIQSLHQGGATNGAYTTGNISLTGGTCFDREFSPFETCTYNVKASEWASGTLHLSKTEVININPVVVPSADTTNTFKVTRTNTTPFSGKREKGLQMYQEDWGSSDSVEVSMGQSVTVNEDTVTMLTTESLMDCSAIAILTGFDGINYTKRTLMHLNGSNVYAPLNYEENAKHILSEAKESLQNGGKVIICGGMSSQSDFGLEITIRQKEILDLIKMDNTDVVIAGSKSISVSPDGSFTLDGFTRGELDEETKHQIVQNAIND